jgi:hypothetical protein
MLNQKSKKMMRKHISVSKVSDMDRLALSIRGGQFATIWYRSNLATMNAKLIGGKKNPLHGRLEALTGKTSLQIADDYERVMRKRLNNPNFVADRLPFGHWLAGAYKRIIEHKGLHYFRAYPTDNTLRKAIYVLDGKVVTDPDLKKYIVSQLRQPKAAVNDFRYDNIVCVKASGVTYNVSL